MILTVWVVLAFFLAVFVVVASGQDEF